ncbi:uncharacterized protein [Dysidea avara]|uniref:uncharacterized protein n=1 Tax=Dysidea avara TaxID=196820 RepID=UPI00332F07BB
MINVHDALSVVQRTLVLLGNANELVSQTRRCNILRSVDQGLEKYGKEPPTNSEEFLFGKEFCPKLKATVESDKTLAQVVQISHRYQPYDQKSRQSTLGRTLNLNLHLLPRHTLTPVAGRAALFLENWACLTKDPWVLSTIRGYQIPLECLPEQHRSTITVSREQQSVLQEEVSKLREKGAVHPVQQSEAHIISPIFVVPKSGGGWRLIIDLRYLNSHIVPPHFKMEGLYMLPSIISQGWFMVKLDLKDAYLTIPVAQESWNLLTFQAGPPHNLMQFQCLPFGLCTAPFTFSKVTKPATQFLRQLGIHLIIYLDDLLLAAPTKDQLLVDLSTAIWLLTSLGFLINIPKSITAPTCHLEFLGFIVDTDNMVISLPAHKLHCIQKKASHLLSLDRIPMRTLACFIGTLVATKPAVWTGPLHYRALQDMKIRSLRQHPHYQGSVSLSKEARVDLQWWCSELPSHCSAPIWKPEASTVIESDASKLGWGAVCQGVPTGGRWTLEETKFHINYLELKAIFTAKNTTFPAVISVQEMSRKFSV